MESSSVASCVAQDVYLMVDISATLTSRKFAKDLDAVLHRSKLAGVQKIVCRATNCQNSRESLRLSRLHPETLFCSAGVGPNDSRLWDDDSEHVIRELVSNPECVAIGECGIDFSRDYSPHVTQIEVFRRLVQMACNLKDNGFDKPLLVVEKNAFREVSDILSQYSQKLPKIVIQGFQGSKEEAIHYLTSGYYLSLNGLLCKESSSGIRALLSDKSIVSNKFMVASDSPWAYPNARASKLCADVKNCLTERSLGFLNRYCTFQRNEPCSLATTLELIAAYMGVKAEEVALQTTYNALRVFGLTA